MKEETKNIFSKCKIDKNKEKKKKFFTNDGLLTIKKKGMRDVDISLYEKSLKQKTVFLFAYFEKCGSTSLITENSSIGLVY